jgi:hypothetical protein
MITISMSMMFLGQMLKMLDLVIPFTYDIASYIQYAALI